MKNSSRNVKIRSPTVVLAVFSKQHTLNDVVGRATTDDTQYNSTYRQVQTLQHRTQRQTVQLSSKKIYE